MMSSARSDNIRVHLADDSDRQTIYALRHEIYAREIHQHAENPDGILRDALDDDNDYIVVTAGGVLAGFVSITSPRVGSYSIDKYLQRDALPFALDGGTYEIRILTAIPAFRGTMIPILLMYAAFRWVEAHGGSRIVALGRREVRGLYTKAGLQSCGDEFLSGSVAYSLMTAAVTAIRARLNELESLVLRMERTAQWDLLVPFRKPAECFHGGAFFTAVGDEFDRLDRSREVINADVLDAWFPPSPRVLAALREHLPWLLRTSPPTGCEGMVRAIARARGVDPACILPGAGSSALIFLALREWLSPSSRVLIPEPAYGEYVHVLEKVIRCRVDRLTLDRGDHYRVDPARLADMARKGYDLIVLVNPNSPTGRHVPREELQPVLRDLPPSTLVWIDETYVEYAGAGESLERFAVTRPNVVVCKSMSKVYALSGARCAYLCASPYVLERLRAITPPWAVSLPGQVAAVAALEDADYYAGRYRQTHVLRGELAGRLSRFRSWDIVPGVANFLMCHLPEDGLTAMEMVSACREEDLFIRDASLMGRNLGKHAIRIAIKDRPANDRIMATLRNVIERAADREARIGRMPEARMSLL